MPLLSKNNFPISTIVSLVAAVIAIISASSIIISDPTIVTQTLVVRTFFTIFTTKIVYMLFFWVYFCAIYIACSLHDKYHPNTLGKPSLISKNYQLTIWIWLPAAFIIYFVHQMNNLDADIEVNSLFYISNLLKLVFSSAANTIQIILATILLFGGAVMVTMGRVSIDGYWKTHIYKYENQSIQKKHIYSKVRHPIYNGQNYMAIGTALIFDTVFCLLFPVALIIFNSKRANNEEEELSKITGLKYGSYKRNVPYFMWYPFM